MKLARALASVGDADLVSCADLDEGAALRTAREFGFARHYQDYGEMLAKPESTEGGRRVSVLKRQEGVPVNLG